MVLSFSLSLFGIIRVSGILIDDVPQVSLSFSYDKCSTFLEEMGSGWIFMPFRLDLSLSPWYTHKYAH
jgi:hypothetical protein